MIAVESSSYPPDLLKQIKFIIENYEYRHAEERVPHLVPDGCPFYMPSLCHTLDDYNRWENKLKLDINTMITRAEQAALTQRASQAKKLYNAVIGEQIETVKTLLNDGVRFYQMQASAKSKILLAAAADGFVEVVRIILQDPWFDLEYQSRASVAVITASYNCQLGIITELLTDPRVDANYRDHKGSTALIVAAKNAYVEIVNSLLQIENIQINLVDRENQTALGWLVWKDCYSVVLALLNDVRLDVGLHCQGAQALIYLLTKGDSTEVGKLVANPKVDINYRNNHKKMALIEASRSGLNNRVVAIIERADFDPEKHGQLNEAFSIACQLGHIEIVRELSNTVDFSDIDQAHAFLIGANVGGHTAVVKLLVLKYIALDKRSAKFSGNSMKGGKWCPAPMVSFLDWACAHGQLDVVQTLLGKASYESYELANAFVGAVDNADQATIDFLLNKSVVRDRSVLRLLSTNGHCKAVQVLLESHGCQYSNADIHKALFASIGHVNVFKLILRQGNIDINARQPSSLRVHPKMLLEEALESKSFAIVLELLQYPQINVLHKGKGYQMVSILPNDFHSDSPFFSEVEDKFKDHGECMALLKRIYRGFQVSWLGLFKPVLAAVDSCQSVQALVDLFTQRSNDASRKTLGEVQRIISSGQFQGEVCRPGVLQLLSSVPIDISVCEQAMPTAGGSKK